MSGGEGGGSVICNVMERSVPPDLVEVALLGVSNNSSCWHIL
jgi:hypothetical protein